MSRSSKKGPFVDPKLYFKVEKLNERSFRGSWMGFAYCDFHHQGGNQMLMARASSRPRSPSPRASWSCAAASCS